MKKIALTKTRLIISGIILITLLAISSFKQFFLPADLIIELKSNSSSQIYEVYYNMDNDFNEIDSEKIYIGQINEFSTLRFKLPKRQIIQMRFDPGSEPDTISIKSISLDGLTKKHSWDAAELLKIIEPVNNIESITYKDNLVHIITNGNDPYLLFTEGFNNILRSIDRKIRIRYLYLISIILSGSFLIFSPLLKKPKSFLIKFLRKLIKELFKLKFIVPFACFTIIFLLFFPHIAIQFSEDLAHSLHNKLVFTTIVDSTIKKEDTKQRQIDSLFNFTRNHLFVFSGYNPITENPLKSPLNILIRGIGWCDRQSYVFIKLLEEINVKGRLIFLYRMNTRESNHSVSEIFFNNQWIMYDPLYAQVYKNKNTNQYLSVQEIHELVTSNRQNLIVNTVITNIADLDLYSGKHIIHSYNNITHKKEFFVSVIESYNSIFGKFFRGTFQNSYFSRYKHSDSQDDLYRKAKMHYFIGRYKKAREIFSNIIETNQLSQQYIDSLLWGSINLLKLKKHNESISMLEQLENTDSKWKISAEVIAFYKGLNHLGMGKMEIAKNWLLKADTSTTREYHLKKIFNISL